MINKRVVQLKFITVGTTGQDISPLVVPQGGLLVVHTFKPLLLLSLLEDLLDMISQKILLLLLSLVCTMKERIC
jgi:hypothetical protein